MKRELLLPFTVENECARRLLAYIGQNPAAQAKDSSAGKPLKPAQAQVNPTIVAAYLLQLHLPHNRGSFVEYPTVDLSRHSSLYSAVLIL